MTPDATDKKSRKSTVIFGVIVAAILLIGLAWTCYPFHDDLSDEEWEILYESGYLGPSTVALRIGFMDFYASLKCVEMGISYACPDNQGDTMRRVMATMMTQQAELYGPGQYGNAYTREYVGAINHLFYGLILRLESNPCQPIGHGYVSSTTMARLQHAGYIHSCLQGWKINSKWAERFEDSPSQPPP